jgi:hypothetical protein
MANLGGLKTPHEKLNCLKDLYFKMLKNVEKHRTHVKCYSYIND